MAMPGVGVTVVASGGVPVSEAPAGFGVTMTPVSNGIPVTIIADRGIPIAFIGTDGAPWPGGVAPGGGGGSTPTFYLYGF